MQNSIQIGSVIALIVIAMGMSVSVFAEVSTPAKISMFAFGVITGILIGRVAIQNKLQA